MSIKTLKVISSLLSYPQLETIQALPEMAEVLEQEALLPENDKLAVQAMMQTFSETDLLLLQARYVSAFDRGRALSLHLFEHIHGESRDRGQAMVDLMNLYERHGFHMAARELPDFIPLFLEFLSECPLEEARRLLSDAMHILTLLGARLAERKSYYQALFDALAGFAGSNQDKEGVRQQVAQEGPDPTLVNMDKIWEEEAVRFMPSGQGCDSQLPTSNDPAPVHWHGPRPGKRANGGR